MASFHGTRQMIPLTVIIFFLFTAIGCLTPFLSIHMRDQGLTLRETAYINMVAAFFSVLGPPLFGTISEKHAKYKTMFVLSLLLSGLAYTALLFVPRIIRTPRQPLVEFDCSTAVNVEKCENWDSCADAALDTLNLTTFHLSECQYKCPSSYAANVSYPLHVCFHGDETDICIVYEPSEENATISFNSRFISWYHDEYKNVDSSQLLDSNFDSPSLINICSFKPVAPIVVNKKHYTEISCRPLPESCFIKCHLGLQEGDKQLKPAPCVKIIGNPILTFWAYLGVRAVADLGLVTAVCLLDAITISSTNDYDGTYGRTRVLGALALAIFPPISGFLIDYYSDISEQPDYSPSVFIFDGLALITCALAVALPLSAGWKGKYIVTPEKLMKKKHKFWSLEMIFLLFLVVVLGVQWGYIETFMHWFYSDLGCTKWQIGLTLTVAFICSLPFLAISKNMVHNIGRANLLVFAFLFYAIRYAGISYISTPWWTLPFESMETFSLSVMWIAAVSYGHSLVPRSSHLIIQYLLNILHFGIGRGLGSILGGFFMEMFGTRQAFRGVAVFSVVLGLLYLTIYHSCLKKSRRPKNKHLPKMANGGWYPMNESIANGETKIRHPILADQDDSDVGGQNEENAK
ncbi:major facilitator superfamily domain-containing protein 6-like protein B [Tachypleus tridentatus]|uniref:major facilitator superfamily domain-containing protein 6-like protein B n=1 Tax=Tachypleus tridentatus TaxID=6853 RepID=UPI003FCFB0C0